jgi:outer membrane protein
MKKSLAVVMMFMFLSVPMIAMGQTPQTLKIAYVDLQKVMLESEKGKEARKGLTDEMEKLKKSLSAKQDELQKMKDALERQGATITPEARADKEKQYQSKLKDYQRAANDFETELRQKDMEFTSKILKDLEEVIRKLGETEKYTLLLEKSQAGILYATPAIDITDKVISIYNDSSKKKAAPK